MKRPKKKPMRLVLVIWHDAHSTSSSWTSADEADDVPCVVRSVGYLLDGWKRGHVSIAQSIEGEFRDSVLAIPTGMVQRIIEIAVDET